MRNGLEKTNESFMSKKNPISSEFIEGRSDYIETSMQLQNTASEKAEFLSKTKKPRNIPNKSQFLYFFPFCIDRQVKLNYITSTGMGRN